MELLCKDTKVFHVMLELVLLDFEGRISTINNQYIRRYMQYTYMKIADVTAMWGSHRHSLLVNVATVRTPQIGNLLH